jgi:acyl carrier protein
MTTPIADRIVQILKKEASNGQGIASEPDDSTTLEELDIDSLGFATMIVLLEREYGVNPFTKADVTTPDTVGEMIAAYAKA